MVGIAERASLEIGCQRVRRVHAARRIGIAEAGLLAVGPWNPAEEMIEGAVLHREENDVTDGRRFFPGGSRKAFLRRLVRGGIAASGDEDDERSERRTLAAHESLLPAERALRDTARLAFSEHIQNRRGRDAAHTGGSAEFQPNA